MSYSLQLCSTDKFNGLGIFLDTYVLSLCFVGWDICTYLRLDIYRYANSRHSYSFPRVVGMLGDGNTDYDQLHDGDSGSIGACSVSIHPWFIDALH